MIIDFKKLHTKVLHNEDEDITALSKSFQSNETNVPKLPDEDQKPDSTYPFQTKNLDLSSNESYNEETLETAYSEEYITHNTIVLITRLLSEFTEWENAEDITEALLYISNVKDLLNEFSRYLYQKPHTRILISTLKMLFSNNNWENIKPKQIQLIKRSLEKFQSGSMKITDLKNFSRDLYQNKIDLLNKNDE